MQLKFHEILEEKLLKKMHGIASAYNEEKVTQKEAFLSAKTCWDLCSGLVDEDMAMILSDFLETIKSGRKFDGGWFS